MECLVKDTRTLHFLTENIVDMFHMHAVRTATLLPVLSSSSWLCFTNPTKWSICLETAHFSRNLQQILSASQRNSLYDKIFLPFFFLTGYRGETGGVLARMGRKQMNTAFWWTNLKG
jgi:hypothetical protein